MYIISISISYQYHININIISIYIYIYDVYIIDVMYMPFNSHIRIILDAWLDSYWWHAHQTWLDNPSERVRWFLGAHKKPSFIEDFPTNSFIWLLINDVQHVLLIDLDIVYIYIYTVYISKSPMKISEIVPYFPMFSGCLEVILWSFPMVFPWLHLPSPLC